MIARSSFLVAAALVVVAAAGTGGRWLLAQEPSLADEVAGQLPRVKPLAPEASRDSLKMSGSFRAELVAAEPQVRDPVALDFDAQGRMYVVQLPPYNAYVLKDFPHRGSIRLLEDADQDGYFEKSTLFENNLTYPTAIACWDGGIFVGDAPELLYLKDTDGDGKADQRTVVFSGFGSDRAGESHLNSIRWGLDHRFHISTSLSGGNLTVAAAKDAAPVSIRGRGVMFDPRDLSRFELTSGGGQHGMSMDNWGHKFVCSNSVPAQTLMYDDRYVVRNPQLQAPPAAVDIAPEGKFTKLLRISPPEPWRVLRTKLRKEGKFRGSDEGGKPFGFFTGATGITIYRGDAWPAEYRGNLLVGDVANNLIYRAKLEPDGLKWIARRADPQAEFLASRDIWFRPVQLANAPDGSLLVMDMYRELIEGAAFLPPEFLKHIPAASGHDRGRIYRIVPKDHASRKSPRLATLSSEQLVALIDHPNGWHRDTATRLLYQRQDHSTATLLRKLVTDASLPEARATALHALRGLGLLSDSELLTACDDRVAEVRVQAMQLAESLVDNSPRLRARLLQAVDDPSIRVRYQAAFSLGAFPHPQRAATLARLAIRDKDNAWIELAIQSSSHSGGAELFEKLAGDADYRRTAAGKRLLVSLANQIGARGRDSEIAVLLGALGRLPDADKGLSEAVVQALVARQQGPARERILAAAGGKANQILKELLAEAQRLAVVADIPQAKRVEAIKSLQLASFDKVQPLFEKLLQLDQPQPVQAAALETVGRFEDPQVADLLLKVWPGLSPTLRAQATETLLSRADWIGAFLNAVEQDVVARADLDTSRVQLLKQHPDKKLAARVTRLFPDGGLGRRQDVVARYQPALEMEGDPKLGREVFRKNCSACHRLAGIGTAVGADLKAIRQRGLPSVLLNVLDPNREVKPKFLTYVLATRRGNLLTGMIVAESANSITIRRPDGTQASVQRTDIEELRSTGTSFMSEGLEKQIDIPSMAHLLAFLETAE